VVASILPRISYKDDKVRKKIVMGRLEFHEKNREAMRRV